MEKKIKKSSVRKKNNSYPNPSIVEALCEIHFYSKVDYDEKLLNLLKDFLSKDYPGFAEQRIKQYKAELNESGVSVKEDQNNNTRWIFKHKERNCLIQIQPGVVTINQVGSYPGWKIFNGDIIKAWEIINKIFPIVTMKRIGLRYINKIPKNVNESLSAWLKDTPYFPKAILKNNVGFLSRSEICLSTKSKLLVNIVEHFDNKSFLFDLDIITLASDDKKERLMEIVDVMHRELFEVFSKSLTPKYQSFLEGKL